MSSRYFPGTRRSLAGRRLFGFVLGRHKSRFLRERLSGEINSPVVDLGFATFSTTVPTRTAKLRCWPATSGWEQCVFCLGVVSRTIFRNLVPRDNEKMSSYIERGIDTEELFYFRLEGLKAQIYRFLTGYNFRLWVVVTKKCMAVIKTFLLILTIKINKIFSLPTAC